MIRVYDEIILFIYDDRVKGLGGHNNEQIFKTRCGGGSWSGRMRVFLEILYNVSRIMRFRGTAAAHSGSLNKGEKKKRRSRFALQQHPPRDQLTDGQRYIRNNTSK